MGARNYLTHTHPTTIVCRDFFFFNSIENQSPNFEAVYKNERCHLDIAYVNYAVYMIRNPQLYQMWQTVGTIQGIAKRLQQHL